MAGARLTGTAVAAHRVVIFGAGAAGTGIARLLRATFRQAGLNGDDLTRAIAMVDTEGLLVAGGLPADPHLREFAWPAWLAEWFGLGNDERRDLLAVVRALHPTLLIGTSAQPGAFDEEVIRAMAAHVARPLVFPMSNPTSNAEAVPADVVRWTEGRALVATGSPFDPVDWEGRRITIGQGNNAFVFPGIGLGVLVSEAREVTDSMFAAAARQLAASVSDADLAAGSLFPSVRDIRRVTDATAAAVVREARDSGTGRFMEDGEVEAEVARAIWEPAYLPLDPAPAVRAAAREPALAGSL